MGCLLTVCMVLICVCPSSPASSGGSGSSTASPPPGSSMGTTASSKLGTAQGESCRTRCMHGLPTDCVYGIVLCVPAQLAAAAAAAVPRHHHHRPRAWGRRHRASWGRHKVSRAVRAACMGCLLTVCTV
ncbi:hypothetical protein PF003_g891 [Phytophthora fragariae]|nr:hypothetical protein PF003_g891 [Phytophthora fragariae]